MSGRAGPPAHECGYVLTNGIRLFYVAAGKGPLVLFCHGFPEYWYSWRAQLAALSDECRAVAIDLRGFHRSDKPASGYDIKTLTADLAGCIRAFGSDDAVVVGHDLGGMLAWQFALDYPALTRAVVSLNTPFLPRPPVPYTKLFRLHAATQYVLAFQEPGAAEAMIEADVPGFISGVFLALARNRAVFSPAVLDRYARALAPHGASAPPLAHYRSFDRNWELTAEDTARTIRAPALMMAADADPVFPAALSESITTWIPTAEREVIADCGHWTQQERPAEVTSCLRRFLRAVSN